MQPPHLLASLFLLTLVFASVHTKMAGAAWLALAVVGLHGWWSRKPLSPNSSKSESALTTAVKSAAKVWLLATIAALVFKAVPMFYWASAWNERHAELRLFIGALGSYGLLSATLQRQFPRWLSLAIGLSCVGAIVLLLHFGSEATPTNRIPWASGVSLLLLAALGVAFIREGWEKAVLTVLSILGIGAIFLLSEVRGSMAIAPVGLLLLTLLLFRKKLSRNSLSRNAIAATALFTVIITASSLIPISKTQLHFTSIARIEAAEEEAAAFFKNEPDTQNTSVGARLHLWAESLPHIKSNLLWGVGKEQRFALIHKWGEELNSPVIQSLGHVHNDYLQTLLEHGLWGLASFLSYTLGLLLAARKLWLGSFKTQALTIGAITIMHSLASVTNMNFAHNYYPTLLSLSVSITLLSAMLQTYNDKEATKTT